MIETLKPGTGRMGVVVPHGVLFRGSSEGKIRQKLIDENLLDGNWSAGKTVLRYRDSGCDSDFQKGRCEQVPDMRSSYSSGAHPRGTS
jgi:type I restriction enzyme M protein